MRPFDRIRNALLYIDAHLDEALTIEEVARAFHISAFYFHRMFTHIVGKSMAAYIRARRLKKACELIAETDIHLTEIALECGFDTLPAFSRAFKREYGMAPSEYRRQGISPSGESVEEMIRRFTNRIDGGVFVNPTMMKRKKLYIVGTDGPGEKTGEVWAAYEALAEQNPPKNRIDENGYEVRLYKDGVSTVHVGCAVTGPEVPEGYKIIELPEGEYASFDVYVAQGYDSENTAMNTWMIEHADRYRERLLDGANHVVEFYDERFSGDEANSIVEIWVPVDRVSE